MSEPSQGRSLPWFRVDVDLVDHPKVLQLADAWGVSEADAGWAIIRLWAWTMRYAARGRLAPGARPALERACNVHPTRGDVLGGLVAAGWVDDLGADGWEVHDWGLHNGAAVAKAEKDAERKRAARARRSDGRGQSADGRAPGAGNGTERNGTERSTTPLTPLRGERPKLAARAKAERPPDPRHAPLVAELVEVYASARNGARYPFGPRDAKAVSTLLSQAEPDVIARAWRRALAHTGFPAVATLSELSTHLAHFLAPARGEVSEFAAGSREVAL